MIAEIAAKHGAMPAQVLSAWAPARNTAVIPKSVNPRRIAENFAAGELQLFDEDMRVIAKLDRRYVSAAIWEMEGGPYTVASVWDETD